jgi:enoyl-CoA hydratase
VADEVLVERRDDGVLVVTINRPQAKNALDLAVAEGVAAAVDELDATDDLRVGVLTGSGGTFSAGMDLTAFLRGRPRPSRAADCAGSPRPHRASR